MNTSTQHTSRTTRLAKLADLPYVLDLQRTYSNAVGFLPRPAIELAIEERRVMLADQDAQLAGYMLCTWSRQGVVRVAQVAVEPELLRTTIGTKMMRWLDRCAARGNCSMIRLKSRTNLDANAFWPTCGFRPTGVFIRPTTRARPCIEWTKILADPAALAVEQHQHGRRRPTRHIPPVDFQLDRPA